MFGRLKSSLEKRAPGVVGALRSLRGNEPEPAAPKAVVTAPVVSKPVVVAAPKPVVVAAPVAKPATPVAKPVAPVIAPEPVAVAAPVAAPVAVVAPVVVAEPVVAPVAVAAPVVVAAPVAEPVVAPVVVAAPVVAEPVAVTAAVHAPKPVDKKPRHLHADTSSTDVDAYIARAKANGRDPKQIKGTEGINVAEDGEAYAGPLDNESSRAKASKKLLTIDQFECISCGTCVEQTERVFYLPADGKATPIAQEGPMDLIQDAIEACPVTCIHWVTPDEALERGWTSGVQE